jgi:GNAT superfamily N-acetyltransferase
MTTMRAATWLDSYPHECECAALLLDGGVTQIRPIRPGDAEALSSFHEHLSGETIHRRFFGAHPHLRDEEIARFTEVDYRDRLALVAEVEGDLVGVARYDRPPGTDRAEVAFVVADALQGHGLGTLLLEHLVAAARRRGVGGFEAQTLGTNYQMLRVFGQTGFDCVQRWADGVVEVSFSIAPTQRYLEAVINRDLLAVRAWLRPFLGSDGAGGLGLVCPTRASAEAVVSACRAGGLDVSATVVTDELGIDVVAGLSYLAQGDCDVIVVEWAGPVIPRRVVALAREVARHRPLVVLTDAEDVISWCDQAGADAVRRIETLIEQARARLAERGSGAWRGPQRGTLVEPPVDCDSSRARDILDRAGHSGAVEAGSRRTLGARQVRDLLGAYGIATRPVGAPGAIAAGTVIFEDEPRLGLVARAYAARAGRGGGVARLLPLTDRDAAELAGAADPEAGGLDVIVDSLLRAARLIDDQPDVSRITIPLGVSSIGDGVAVELRAGPARGTEDDPFVRRWPAIQSVTSGDRSGARIHDRNT